MAQEPAKDTAKQLHKKRGRKSIDSWKSKEWFEVYAPKTFKEVYIGSIPSGNPENLKDRIIESLLFDITGKFHHMRTKLQFRVAQIVGDKCYSRLSGMELTRDYIRSQIHRGNSRIDGIFNFTTADGFIYRVSTFVITRRRAKWSQKHSIRKIIFQVLNEFAKNMPHDRFVRGMIFGKFALNISKYAKTIYPLKECQVRKLKVVKMPEGIADEFFGEDDESVNEIDIAMREHGKSIKAKKLKRKKEDEKRAQEEQGQSSENSGSDELPSDSQPKESPEKNDQ